MKITTILGAGAVVTVLVTVVPATLVDSAANAQGDPSKLPLLSQQDLHYVGGFRLPAQIVHGHDFPLAGIPSPSTLSVAPCSLAVVGPTSLRWLFPVRSSMPTSGRCLSRRSCSRSPIRPKGASSRWRPSA